MTDLLDMLGENASHTARVLDSAVGTPAEDEARREAREAGMLLYRYTARLQAEADAVSAAFYSAVLAAGNVDGAAVLAGCLGDMTEATARLRRYAVSRDPSDL